MASCLNVHNVHMKIGKSESPTGTQSIERATTLLQHIGRHHARGMLLQALVGASGLDRTTTYRTVSALVHAGLVTRDAETKAYRLGLEVMALGLSAMQKPPLVERCTPVMKALARRSGEHVFLVVRSGDYSHCLHLEEGARPIQSFAQTVGSTRLMGLGIPSLALLATMSDDDITAHCQKHQAEYQSYRMTPAKLQRWVRQTRQAGHAQLTAAGWGGVGLRFALGSGGDAALGVIGPATRVTRARTPALATMAKEELARFGLG
jgi:DNA-binding IclR family transcriptional regulator